ncbi:hypothetical protein MAPG_10533 [Magnaporthiopsis poae ATCC 64411]|uniref:Uncharacterized protein n=1 Tax=Magnaporthiopsis poae (strain ATCC 64411 / 73-15) TaxID=644358 RepID=A0A0C4ECU7_MAGP6|nr:hypothetical protein MAPG_10533 [Magnaporthiopsis poae ATCC 64411]
MASVPASFSASQIQAAIEAAKGNSTALYGITAPPWVDSPEFRGTMSILTSCLITLTASIYSALHLNPPMEPGVWPVLRSKLSWLAVGILFPEFVVCCAIYQYKIARGLVSKLNRLHNESESDEIDEEFQFDITYGFFILLGGAAVSIKDICPTKKEREKLSEGKPLRPIDETEDGTGLYRLTPEAVYELAKMGHFLYIRPEIINDKSKHNAIQKALILVQVCWMLVQCVVRKAYNLPLTLLELHTVVHILCALVIYAMWWKKPHDVTTSELVDQRPFEDLIALMVQESRRSTETQNLIIYADPSSAPQVKIVEQDVDERRYTYLKGGPGKDENVPAVAFDISNSSWLLPGQVLKCGIGMAAMSSNDGTQVTPKDLIRFERVVQAIRRLDSEPLPNIQRYRAERHRQRYPQKQLHLAFMLESKNGPSANDAEIWSEKPLLGEYGVPIGVYWTPSWLQMLPHI